MLSKNVADPRMQLTTSILRSRIFGAWIHSVLARTVALVPLVLFAFDQDAAQSADGKSYIAAFVFIAASSYVFNSLAEFRRFGGTGAESKGPLFGAIAALTFAPYILLAAGPSPLDGGALTLAAAVQPAMARARVLLIDGPLYRFAYLSSAIRDLPAAVVGVASLYQSDFLPLMPLAFSVGCIMQFACARALTGGSQQMFAEPSTSSSIPGPALAGLSAIALAAFQPASRLLASRSDSGVSLARYELADRPGYLLAIVIAGGVATELQRRWRFADTRSAAKELGIAYLVSALLMVFAGFVVSSATYLMPESSLLHPTAFLSVLLPALLANTIYLWCALRTRFLLSQGRPGRTVVAYLVGLVALLGSWLTLTQSFEDTASMVAWANVIGFTTALMLLTVAPFRVLQRSGCGLQGESRSRRCDE